ncbi:unnamed protein product [Blepharisma stoltei]|uniref:J domain-containing protein n=1 Tax=Blepharisma stoltei TaxID=1481888 RepID=A0AAU9J8I3_9CILI|nr:unnamed protein product [Blepharisma stoltei]
MLRTLLKRSFASKVDYYQILGIEPSAKPAEVKQAYRELAKKFHPDIAKDPTSQDKFRLITEAYTVLHNLETRTTYDLTKGSKDEIKSILEKRKDHLNLGATIPNYQPHEYGYKRLKELAEERKKYNLDKFYNFRGGVPQKGMEAVRGNSVGQTGERVNTWAMNNYAKDWLAIPRDSDYVGETEAQSFKMYKDLDYHVLSKRKPYMPAEIDYTLTEFRVIKSYALFWTIFVAFFGGIYFHDEIFKAANRLKIEKLKEVAKHGGEKIELVGLKAAAFKA